MNRALTALLVLCVLVHRSARAQTAVSGTCRTQQGDPLPDCVCAGNCPSGGGGGSGGSGASAPAGLTPAQQVFVNGMGAIWSQILQNAMRPSAPAAAPAGPTLEQQQQQFQQRMLERQRQEEALQRQQEAERAAAAAREQQEMADHLNGQLKLDDGADTSLGLKLGEPADQQSSATDSKKPARALDCAMAEVYGAAASLGPGGKSFADGLRRQVAGAKKSLPKNLPDGAPNTCDIAEFSRDSMADDGVRGGSQMTVHAIVTRLRDTGQTQLSILYSVSKGKKTLRDGQDVIVLNSDGGVDCQEVTAATAKCMARMDPKSAPTDYCPRPPPERKPPYPACGSSSGTSPAPAPSPSPVNGTVVDGVPLK